MAAVSAVLLPGCHAIFYFVVLCLSVSLANKMMMMYANTV